MCGVIFHYANKWYIHNSKSFLEKKKSIESLSNFEIQTVNPIKARRRNIVLINKKRPCLVDFVIPADHKVKA